MPIEFKLKPQARLLFAISAAFPLGAYGAGAATLDFVVGDVTAIRSDGRSRLLAKGAEVDVGELVDTRDGRAQLRFSDGAFVSLSPQTQFRVDEYQFKGRADGSEKGFFSLLKGAMRTITGAIGRANRQNYKLGTTVATIGIRGTEFKVAYGNSITVTTGEGVVEVCNTGGCLVVGSGQSAYVRDINTGPVFTQRPAQPSLIDFPREQPQFIAGDQRGSSGLPVLGTMQSADAGLFGLTGGSISGAAFNSASELTGFTQGLNSYAAGTIVDAVNDGVIGWGRWATGTVTDPYGSTTALTDLHYVTGQQTPAADMLALQTGAVTATYSLLGFTYATYGSGQVSNRPVSGSLNVNFGAATVGVSLTVPTVANTYGFNGSVSPIGGSSFSGLVGCSAGPCSGGASVAGLFIGSGASRAGLTYQFSTTGEGNVAGAVAFTRD